MGCNVNNPPTILFLKTILQVELFSEFTRDALNYSSYYSSVQSISRQYQSIAPSVYPKYAGYLRAKLSILHTFRGGGLFYIFELFTFQVINFLHVTGYDA